MSRGGGPEHRFVKAIHPSALNGDLRVTEQGEAIEQKYANRLTAVYNLELLFAGVARATLLDWHCPEPPHVLEPTMDWLAEHSRQTYVRLRQAEGFLTFFRQATPIDVIEESRIGSRPSRRTRTAGARRSARHPVGVQLEPGPLLSAGVVRSGQRPRGVTGAAPGRVRPIVAASATRGRRCTTR